MFTWLPWHCFATLAMLVCAGAVAGCGQKDVRPTAGADSEYLGPQPAGGPPAESPPESLANVKADIVLTAAELFQEAQRNPMFLDDDKYAGKVVEVSGIIEDLQMRPAGGATIVLRGGKEKGKDPTGGEVDEKGFMTTALTARTIVLRIRGPKGALGWKSFMWTVVEAKELLPTLTAEQFAHERATLDQAEFQKKYPDGRLLITGVISKVEKTDDRVFLDGGKNELVEFWLGGIFQIPLSENQKSLIKIGQTVKVRGEYFSGVDRFINCVLVEPAR
jgi:hypothetical protein